MKTIKEFVKKEVVLVVAMALAVVSMFIITPDKEYVESLRERMRQNGGYCPCRLQRIPENICICGEFRKQMADPAFEGYCHCKLYYKEK